MRGVVFFRVLLESILLTWQVKMEACGIDWRTIRAWEKQI